MVSLALESIQSAASTASANTADADLLDVGDGKEEENDEENDEEEDEEGGIDLVQELQLQEKDKEDDLQGNNTGLAPLVDPVQQMFDFKTQIL